MKYLLPILTLLFTLSVTGQKPFVFNEDVTTLPINYKGNSSAELSKAISDIQNPRHPEKGEFEKTVDYEKRVEEWKNRAPILIRKHILTDEQSVKYNADTETMLIELSLKYPITFEAREESSTYETQNGFGAKVTVRKTHKADFAIYVNHEPTVEVQLKLSPSAAQKLKPNIRTLLIFDLISPYSKIDILPRKAPTFLDPVETTGSLVTYFGEIKAVWFVDAETGKVFIKKQL